MYLNIEAATVHYNKVVALKELSLNLEKGGFITLIGSNGAGKSTTLRMISGLVKASSGIIQFDGQQIQNLEPDQIVKLGIAHVPEGRRVFKELSVIENLYLGAFIRNNKAAIEQDLQEIFAMFPKLFERQNQMAGSMSGGERQMLAIGRALMCRPKVLLLDEPSLGLAPIIVQEIAEILTDLNKNRGVSIILVEQNADLALELADYAYVLETGQLALQGKADDLMDNEHVRSAYLGI